MIYFQTQELVCIFASSFVATPPPKKKKKEDKTKQTKTTLIAQWQGILENTAVGDESVLYFKQ